MYHGYNLENLLIVGLQKNHILNFFLSIVLIATIDSQST